MPLSDVQRAFLLASFDSISEALSFRTTHGLLADQLLQAYEKPDRHYHNAEHLFHCITELQNCPAPQDPHIGPALWFHDVIYDPTRDDNEACSADLLRQYYSGVLNLPRGSLLTVQRLILATDHRNPPTAPDEALITDIDLAILGQPRKIFDTYERNIRQEYAHVPDADFRTSRARILQSFLDRKAIYHTPRFRRRYETLRENLARSLESLG